MARSVPTLLGSVTHYYSHVGAAIVQIDSGELRVGDTLHFRGRTTDFYQRVERLELEHQPIQRAVAGQDVGIQVSQRVREHDEVFRLSG
ncbi:MAG: hypothetical protein V3T33_06190 [Myxococcota bacterium]